MKAIILVSSIFYILGLKISNKIDLIKHPRTPAAKVIVREAAPALPKKTFDATKESIQAAQDSIRGGGMTEKILESK